MIPAQISFVFLSAANPTAATTTNAIKLRIEMWRMNHHFLPSPTERRPARPALEPIQVSSARSWFGVDLSER